jgi:hypothetical protein
MIAHLAHWIVISMLRFDFSEICGDDVIILRWIYINALHPLMIPSRASALSTTIFAVEQP